MFQRVTRVTLLKPSCSPNCVLLLFTWTAQKCERIGFTVAQETPCVQQTVLENGNTFSRLVLNFRT